MIVFIVLALRFRMFQELKSLRTTDIKNIICFTTAGSPTSHSPWFSYLISPTGSIKVIVYHWHIIISQACFAKGLMLWPRLFRSVNKGYSFLLSKNTLNLLQSPNMYKITFSHSILSFLQQIIINLIQLSPLQLILQLNSRYLVSLKMYFYPLQNQSLCLKANKLQTYENSY